MAKDKSNWYYKKFNYRIEKKITVEDFPKIKDFAKREVYFYIIHENTDNNRFLLVSSVHYEENSKIMPETFKLQRIASTKETVHLKRKISRFGTPFYRVILEGVGDEIVDFGQIIYSKNEKEGKMFKKFKTHTKKIAVDNPDWYLEYILSKGIKSHQKKVMRMLLCENKYNEEIVEHCISTLFKLENPDYQRYNDHSIILDGGKTGKSSLIGYASEKLDNISIAGLYGSSDSKHGKFKGGIVTTTDRCIIIDELNELIKNGKGDRILSVLNSVLENGSYNYQKQFGQKIKSANLFFFMGNIGDEMNFPLILMGTFGNVETVGRRIGVITYSTSMRGFEKGNIRPSRIPSHLNAISIFMSNLFNEILCKTSFLKKVNEHAKYRELGKMYRTELTKIEQQMEGTEHDCVTTRAFIKSHKETIDRTLIRALKMHIFENLDKFITGEEKYDNHLSHKILCRTELLLKRNILNIQNIKEHLSKFKISDKTPNLNLNDFNSLNKTEQKVLEVFWENKGIINNKGVKYEDLSDRAKIKHFASHVKNRGIKSSQKNFFIKYGINIEQKQSQMICRIVNFQLFIRKLEGVFNKKSDEKENVQKRSTKTEQIENAWKQTENDGLV